MSVIEISQLVSFGIAALFVVIVFQVINISRRLPRSGWIVVAIAFGALGALQAYRFIRSAATLMDAQRQGYKVPDQLTLEQWLVVVWVYAVIIAFIVGFYLIRRGLRNQGLD